ncbi:MAG: metal-sensitive transcriptional regulator [Chloroflexi bacterium]|nr:metal-sensitive transcriptional regulator [Chloroflexota bacterium]
MPMQDAEDVEVVETTASTLVRLRRIEGQIRGLQRMLEEGRDCAATLTQLMAVRAALDAVGRAIVREYMDSCLELPDTEEAREKIVRIVELFLKLA